ncbi:hypothetical protein PP707_01580 [Acetobacter pasteurianus]|nr:hypothetical protein [Acetobacter pasteurianus]
MIVFIVVFGKFCCCSTSCFSDDGSGRSIGKSILLNSTDSNERVLNTYWVSQ